MLKVGSLCSGYGGLDMAVEAFFNAETVWMSDIDKYASIAITERWNKPNLGDLTKVDWSQVEPIDILTAGYPCQPFSHAGQRKGTKDERHIWPQIAEIIGKLKPSIIILENVRGHLSLGFKEVLKDLAQLGYDAKWRIVRASDVGAPHQRARLFVFAYSDSERSQSDDEYKWNYETKSQRSSTFFTGSVVTSDTDCDAREESRRAIGSVRSASGEIINRSDWKINGSSLEIQRANSDSVGQSLGEDNSESTGNQRKSQFITSGLGEIGSDSDHQQLPSDRQMSELGWRFDTRFEMSMRPIPNPLVDGKLNTKFVEYMMGLPEGWVTDLPISRSQQFKMLGNGVVPQQAYEALSLIV